LKTGRDAKRILFLSGSRADYGKMKPLMMAVEEHPKLKCSIALTGMHLLPKYGLTASAILLSGFTDIHTFANQEASVPVRRDQIVANTIKGLSSLIAVIAPDMLVLHGDRPETLAGAISGSMNLLLTAHIEGGELSGTIDETIRHAVSKLVNIHFVSNEQAQKRLLQLGETESSIHIIGSPNIDVMLGDNLPEISVVRDRYQIDFAKYIIFLYHPVAYELEGLEARINRLLDAIRESGRCCVAIFPNNEPGSDVIINAYESRAAENWLRVLPSMRFEYFLTLLKFADGIVGNSSAGIHEAPIYGVPTVNLGTRQKNRFHHEGIINIPEYAEPLLATLTRMEEFKGKNTAHFGDGKSCERFISVLTGDEVWETSMEKQFVDKPQS
jgi:UDP-N-acetylglucosamine 2-epimerase (hydrolysing)